VTLCGHEVLAAVLVCTAWSAVFGLYRSVQVAHRRPWCSGSASGSTSAPTVSAALANA